MGQEQWHLGQPSSNISTKLNSPNAFVVRSGIMSEMKLVWQSQVIHFGLYGAVQVWVVTQA